MKSRIIGLERYGEGETYQLKNTLTGEVLPQTLTHSGGWRWTIEYEDGLKIDYRTDKDGQGLWKDGNQISGTCQYGSYEARHAQIKKIADASYIDLKAMNENGWG
jgi:hypothetical protein